MQIYKGKTTLAFLLALSLVLVGCQSNPSKEERSDQSHAQTGAVVGALLGAVIGAATGDSKRAAQFAALGALAGGAVGYFGPKLYRNLSQDDQQTHDVTRERVLRQVPDGEGLAWSNPDTNASGNVKAVRSYKDQDGTVCRSLEESVVLDGKSDTANTNNCWDDEFKKYRVASN